MISIGKHLQCVPSWWHTVSSFDWYTGIWPLSWHLIGSIDLVQCLSLTKYDFYCHEVWRKLSENLIICIIWNMKTQKGLLSTACHLVEFCAFIRIQWLQEVTEFNGPYKWYFLFLPYHFRVIKTWFLMQHVKWCNIYIWLDLMCLCHRFSKNCHSSFWTPGWLC